MQKHAERHNLLSAPMRRRTSCARLLGPRMHLRILPTSTRPSLFGGD